MTIITPAILAELHWLIRSKYTITVIDKTVLAELVTVWEAAKLAHDTDRMIAGEGARALRDTFNPAAPELPLFQPDAYPPDLWHDHT